MTDAWPHVHHGWVLTDASGEYLAIVESVKRDGQSEPAFIMDVEAYARTECGKCPACWRFRIAWNYQDGALLRAVVVYAENPDAVHFAGL